MSRAGQSAALLLAGATDADVLLSRRASQDVFAEEPVPLTAFVQDRGYLANPPLSEVQYEAVRHAERVFYAETYDLLAGSDDRAVRGYWSQPCRMVNFLELEWGKGGGKDHTCRMVAMRVCYLLLCLRSPQEYYAMPEQDSIHCLNVASSSKQAQRAFFTPMRRAVTRPGCWFQRSGIVDILDAAERQRRGSRSEGRATALLDTIKFEHNIEAVSGHSEADSQEGLNLILGIADEIDAFRSNAELARLTPNRQRESSSSAEAILDMLRTSAAPQPLDALVLTPGGWKRMGDVRVGDQVVDPGGAESFVEGVYPQGRMPVYRLTFSDGTSAEATGNHLWAVERRTMRRAATQPGVCASCGSSFVPKRWDQRTCGGSCSEAWRNTRGGWAAEREIVTTQELRNRLLERSRGGNSRAHPCVLPDAPVLRVLDFPEEPLFIDPYLLGLLLGDGGLTHTTPQFTTEDEELARAARGALPDGMRLALSGVSGNAYMYNLVNGKGRPNPLTAELRRLGLWGKRSPEKFVPWQYKYASAATRLAVLQGLMDTDGHNSQGNMGGFGSTSEALRDDVVWLARSLGLQAVLWKDEECPVGLAAEMTSAERRAAGLTLMRRRLYRAGIEETPETRIFRLPRKLRAKFGNRRFRRRLVSVEYAGVAECQCIAVSAPSHLYLTDDFIPTHNTRFPQTYKCMHISYPRYLGSTIQKLVARGRQDNAEKGDRSRYYVSGPLASWDANPRIPGKHAFSEDYEKDPALAEAKYECRPRRAVNPYFANETAIRECCREVAQQPVAVDYVRERASWRPLYTFAPGFYPVKGALYAMHADLAQSGDRAGLAMAHIATWQDHVVTGEQEDKIEVRLTERRPVVKVDFVLSYSSNPGAVPPMEIQIRWARLLCLELRRMGFPITRFTFDQWQSKDSMQILEAQGIETDRFSTDVSEEGWRTLRDVMYEGRLDMPLRELVVTELLGLSRLPNGKVDHLGDSSKDEADALAGAVCGALEAGGQEDPSGERAYLGEAVFYGPEPDISLAPLGMVPLRLMQPDRFMPVDRPGMEAGPGYLDDWGSSPDYYR